MPPHGVVNVPTRGAGKDSRHSRVQDPKSQNRGGRGERLTAERRGPVGGEAKAGKGAAGASGGGKESVSGPQAGAGLGRVGGAASYLALCHLISWHRLGSPLVLEPLSLFPQASPTTEAQDLKEARGSVTSGGCVQRWWERSPCPRHSRPNGTGARPGTCFRQAPPDHLLCLLGLVLGTVGTRHRQGIAAGLTELSVHDSIIRPGLPCGCAGHHSHRKGCEWRPLGLHGLAALCRAQAHCLGTLDLN